MSMIRLGIVLGLAACASSFAVNRSTIEPDHNWKFQFPVKATTNYVESTTEIPIDLNQLTVSFWVDDVSDYYTAFFSTPGNELQLTWYNYRNYRRLYLYVNGAYTYCTGCFSPGGRKHVVVTWSATAEANGVGSFWVNGAKVHTFTGIAMNTVVKKGLRLKLGQTHDSSATYSFRGEIMYFNLYPTYVTTAEEVANLARAATSDSEAVVPWGAFIGGGKGDVVLYPEFEVYTQSFTSIVCNANNMTVTLNREAFPHLIPSRASLKDPNCKLLWDDKQVNVTTSLDECGTRVSYNSSVARYYNYIVPDILNPPPEPSDTEGTNHSVINRGAIALDESRLFVTCKYDLVPRRSIAAYAVASSRYNVEGKGVRDFAFELQLYHDSSYKDAYLEKEYPLHADSRERIYAEAMLASGGEDRIVIRIEKCVMTPDADPNYSTQHVLLTAGCAVDDTVQYHDAPSGLTQRFSFQAFRFNERPTAVVYMHCYIDVCSVGVKGSKCEKGWKSCEASDQAK